MIKNFDFDSFTSIYADKKISKMGEMLARYQRKLMDLDIPVMIIIEGWESAGHEFVINDLIRELNPRNHHVKEYDYSNRVEKDMPFLWKYWKLIPKKGDMTILDKSYYFNLFNNKEIDKAELENNYELINTFERHLSDDNMLILKFFLHVKKKTHKNRIEALKHDKNRSFFVTDIDNKQYKNYEYYEKRIGRMLDKTNYDFAPWHVVSAEDLKLAAREIIGKVSESVINKINEVSKQKEIVYTRKPFTGPYPLNDIDLTLSVDDDIYDKELDELQEEIEGLTYKLFNKNIPTILVFEGMDAAGKGGAIERLTRTMDARFYDVVATSAPKETEKQYHYLWRFYKEFPPRGKTTIFDRSWYGRVMVERVEGFATVQEWDRAYEEINLMEKNLADRGALIIKYFIIIDKDEQYRRFKERESDVDKIYKLTDEDWRNREKWDPYIDSMNEMLVKTHKENAPWIIIEGNDKKFARLKVLREFIQRAKQFIDDK
ncbi:MAG: hypothetical protein GX783_14615 [Clostridiales bacterium]|nr:hypothetical protein [Clostridiales bacterium]